MKKDPNTIDKPPVFTHAFITPNMWGVNDDNCNKYDTLKTIIKMRHCKEYTRRFYNYDINPFTGNLITLARTRSITERYKKSLQSRLRSFDLHYMNTQC